LQKGIPHFGVAISSKRFDVSGPNRLGKEWHHLAAVLSQDGTMKLYVDGAPVAAGAASGLLPKEPANAIQVGADEESLVGPYKKEAVAYKGDMDDLRIYRGEVSAADIAELAKGGTPAPTKGVQLMLHYTFDDTDTTDASGHKNDGELVGGDAVDGRIGDAIRFSGVLPGASMAGKIPYNWSVAPSVLVRGMVASPNCLFVAGPTDILNEDEAVKQMDDEAVMEQLAEQDEAMLGKKGGVLQAVSTQDGTTLGTLSLTTIPVWDGLAAGGGNLYLSGVDGTVRCYKPQP
jgi:hypothetical protein